MLEEKEIYTIRDLFDELDMSLRQFAEQIGLSEVTLARIRDGKPTYRRNANKLINMFARMYGTRLSLSRVTGITIAVSGKKHKEVTV